MIQPKTTDKLTDKAFSRLMLMSILWIFVTLVSLCSLTWAWYSTNVSSSQNTLRTATSSAAITVLDSNGSALPIAGQNAQGQDVYVFEANTPYTVTLTIGENDTANAYCSLVINDFPYHSEPLLASSVHDSLSFQIEFTQKQVGVQVLPHWGILNGTYTFEDLCAYKDLAKVDHSMLTTEEESEETTEGADETVKSPAETEADTPVDEETTETPAETEGEPLIDEETTETPAETEGEPLIDEETTETPAETEADTPVDEETTETPAETEGEPLIDEETTESPAETEGEPLIDEETTESPAETEGEPLIDEETTETPAETEGEPLIDEETTESPAETEQTLEN